jgi:membrane protein
MLRPVRNLAEGISPRIDGYFDRGPMRRGIRSLAQGLSAHHTARVASSMAFNLFLASIPMLAVAGWLLTTVLHTGDDTLGATSALLDVTPTDVRQIIDRHFGRFSAGAVAPVAVLGSFWLASGAFHTLMSVFEHAVDAPRRPWVKKRAIALACVLVAILALGLHGSIAVLLAGGPIRILEAALGGPAPGVDTGRFVVGASAVLTLTALFAGFFRISVRRPGCRRVVWPGAVLTVAIGSAASAALALYGSTIARFSLFYGSLAAVAVALAWLWLWCAAILAGAELNAQLEQRSLGHRLPWASIPPTDD